LEKTVDCPSNESKTNRELRILGGNMVAEGGFFSGKWTLRNSKSGSGPKGGRERAWAVGLWGGEKNRHGGGGISPTGSKVKKRGWEVEKYTGF